MKTDETKQKFTEKTPELSDGAGIIVQDHIVIKDKETEREIVNKRA